MFYFARVWQRAIYLKLWVSQNLNFFFFKYFKILIFFKIILKFWRGGPIEIIGPNFQINFQRNFLLTWTYKNYRVKLIG